MSCWQQQDILPAWSKHPSVNTCIGCDALAAEILYEHLAEVNWQHDLGCLPVGSQSQNDSAHQPHFLAPNIHNQD